MLNCYDATMRQLFDFDKEKHQQSVEQIKGILVDAELFMAKRRDTVRYSYKDAIDIRRSELPSANGLCSIVLNATRLSVEGLRSAMSLSLYASINTEKSSHSVLVESNSQEISPKTVYALTQLITKRDELHRMVSVTVGDGSIHKISGIVLTDDSLYSTVKLERRADEECFNTKAHALIEGGPDSMITALGNGERLIGLRRPRYFEMIENSLKQHNIEMDHESFMEKLLMRYNDGLSIKHVGQRKARLIPELTEYEINEFKKHFERKDKM